MDESKELEEFGREFWQRFDKFRQIEVQEIVKGPFQYSAEAFALLRDIELCYAARAYFSCLVLAHSIIETHLRRIEGIQGRGAQLFKQAGIRDELDWLTKLRNDIVHGNPNPLITYAVDAEEERILEEYCIRAFTVMHELPIRLQRLREER